MLGRVSSRPPDNRKERPPRRGLAALLVGLCLVGVGARRPAAVSRSTPASSTTATSSCRPTIASPPSGYSRVSCIRRSAGAASGSTAARAGRSTTRAATGTSRRWSAGLSVIDARSVEQPVNLDDGDDVFNWPWLYAVEVGQWDLTDSQAAQLREYLLRGGFLMVDDFHGTQRVDDLRREHAARVPGSADRRLARRRSDLSHVLGSRRAAADSRAPVRVQRPDRSSRTASTRTGAASTTTKGA